MTDEFRIKKNDRLPRIRALLTDSAGAVLDLTGATVQFRMRARDGAALKVNAAGVNVGAGIVEYAWATGNTDTPGIYDAEWVLTYAGQVRTVPTAGYSSVVVDDVLG